MLTGLPFLQLGGGGVIPEPYHIPSADDMTLSACIGGMRFTARPLQKLAPPCLVPEAKLVFSLEQETHQCVNRNNFPSKQVSKCVTAMTYSRDNSMKDPRV